MASSKYNLRILIRQNFMEQAASRPASNTVKAQTRFGGRFETQRYLFKKVDASV